MHPKASVILYTRPGCHLCEVAKDQLFAADCADLYEFEEVNIDNDPDLIELYGTLIPVVTINGVEAFRYRVDAAAFGESIRMLRHGV